MPYSDVTDLLVGGIPLPSYLDAAKFVQDAADEIDSQLGLIYQTPFSTAESGPDALSRPVRLFLKRVNNFLASGRLLLAVASPEENRQVHAYGYSLIKEATAALASVASGEITLDAPTLDGALSTTTTLPLIANVDPESNVEAFYDRLANPDYFYPYPSTVRTAHDGFIR